MTNPSNFNAFGSPIVPAAKLSRLERVALLHRAAKQLQAGEVDAYAGAWLALAIQQHLAGGGDLEGLLGIRPPQGCRMTAARLAEAERHGALLLQLSVIAGSDRQAVRILAGKAPCPARARPILAELAGSKGARSLAAFTRARQGVSAHT